MGTSTRATLARKGAPPSVANLPSASLLNSLGISADAFREAAQKQGLWPTGPSVLAKTATTNTGTKTQCELYDYARTHGQQAAIVISLKSKCEAEQARKRAAAVTTGGGSVAIASTGATAPDAAPPASSLSPMVIGAIAVAIGVVGFVAYSRTKKKKR